MNLEILLISYSITESCNDFWTLFTSWGCDCRHWNLVVGCTTCSNTTHALAPCEEGGAVERVERGMLHLGIWWLHHFRSTLPEANIAHENPPFWWYLLGKMGIFTGYVSFREGNPCFLRTCWICMCFAKGKRDHFFSFLRDVSPNLFYVIWYLFCYQRFLFWEARQHYLKKQIILVWQRALTTSALCKELTTVYWCYNMHTGTFCFCKSPDTLPR